MEEPAEWYWLYEGRAVGPTTRHMIEKLVASRAIETETLVSYRGSEWTAAGRTDLAPLIAKAPEPYDHVLEARVDEGVERSRAWAIGGLVVGTALLVGLRALHRPDASGSIQVLEWTGMGAVGLIMVPSLIVMRMTTFGTLPMRAIVKWWLTFRDSRR